MTTQNPPRAAAAPTRRCPGGCHHTIPVDAFLCGPCRDRLPYAMRQELDATRGRDHAAYVRARHRARLWLRHNPPEAQP